MGMWIFGEPQCGMLCVVHLCAWMFLLRQLGWSFNSLHLSFFLIFLPRFLSELCPVGGTVVNLIRASKTFNY